MQKVSGSWRGNTNPKRGICPQCGKKGIGPWKYTVNFTGLYRECRYCLHTEIRSNTN